jgi:hypothetical protein
MRTGSFRGYWSVLTGGVRPTPEPRLWRGYSLWRRYLSSLLDVPLPAFRPATTASDRSKQAAPSDHKRRAVNRTIALAFTLTVLLAWPVCLLLSRGTEVVVSPPGMTANPTAVTTAPSSSASAWTTRYADASITVPAGGQCSASGINFDDERGLTNAEATTDDLTVNAVCPMAGRQENDLLSLDQWGIAQAQESSADQCHRDAIGNALPADVSLDTLKVGNAYCLVTRKNSLVWFKVTQKSGTYQEGFTVTATLWTQNN